VKPIDIRIVEQLRGMEARGRPGLMDKLIRSFADVASVGVLGVREAFKRRDAEAMWRAAHKLRSAASAIGAVRVAARCGAIEEAGRAGRLEGVAAPVRRLATDVAVADAWLRLLAAAPTVSDRWPVMRARA
jgi:HPt (histidine-containing phosphotransfer) domain-containing protein